MPHAIHLADVEAAAARLAGVAHRTPVLTSRTANERTGAQLFFKCENLQRMGAFKFRGAFNALSKFDDAQRRAGVMTFSSGNHAQAIALSAQLLGIPATILMPQDAPRAKVQATRGYGGEVVLYDRYTQDREALAADLAKQRGLTLIPPYDHPDVIAGQGTAALELIEEHGPLDLLLVPCGGGGLLSGSALAARARSPGCRVVGVEPDAADDATRSFTSGVLQRVDNPETIADGARTPSLGRLTFALVRSQVDSMVTVTDADLVRAMRLVWERLKLIVEPTAVLGLAAALRGSVEVAGRRVGVILSGGNVDLTAALALFERLPAG